MEKNCTDTIVLRSVWLKIHKTSKCPGDNLARTTKSQTLFEKRKNPLHVPSDHFKDFRLETKEKNFIKKKEKDYFTCLFFKSRSAAKSSGASDGTLVTIPVPINPTGIIFLSLSTVFAEINAQGDQFF